MTNPAYEATNSDVGKLIADMKDSAEKATPGEWHLSNEHKLIIRDEDHLHIANAGYFDNPVEVADAKHIALANPKNVLKLIAALEQAQRQNGYLREQSAEWERKAISNFEDCSEMSVQIEELESQRSLAFMACNRWRDKCVDAEKRIAELEFAPNGMIQLSNELAEMKRKCVELTVWYGAMPESNGKTNWTAILHRKGECLSTGITIDRSEYPDRVRYEDDRMRYLIGELDEKPWITNYDANKHSGYTARKVTI